MKYTLHNHTYLCKHASGSVIDMVNEAVKQKFDVIGISDHIPYEEAETLYRMDYGEREQYLTEAQHIKKLYQHSKIKIYIGYEAEYQKKYLSYLIKLFQDKEIDYLILGQHYQDVTNLYTYYGRSTTLEQLRNYVDDCIAAFKTNLFWFIAHPDLVLMSFSTYTDEAVLKECERLIRAAIEYDVYLEYNAGGVRNGYYHNLTQEDYLYPKVEFWQLVKKLNGKVVVNADAHSPQQINDAAYKLAQKQVKELGLNLVEPNFEHYYKKIKVKYHF